MDKSGTAKGKRAKASPKKVVPEKRPERTMAKRGSARNAQRVGHDWQALVETSAAWIWETDADLRHIYTNAFVTTCLGYAPAEFLARSTIGLVHPDDHELLRDIVQDAATGEGWTGKVLRWRHKDGSWRYIESSGVAVFDRKGNFKGLRGVDRDITDRIKAEAELRESEGRFRALFENLNVVALVMDPSDGRILDANDAAATYYGWPRERLRSMLIREINTLPPDEILRRMDQVKSRKKASFLLQHRRADGSVRDVEVHSGPIPFGGRTALYSVIHDVTERRQAERQLAESQHMLRNVIDAIPVRVFWKDRESRYRGCNKLFAQDAGRPNPDSLLGEDDFNMAWAEQAVSYRADDSQVMKTGIPKINYEEPQTTPAGDRIWLRTSKIPLRDESGTIYGVLGTYEDITARKRMEEALRRSGERYRSLFEDSPISLWEEDFSALTGHFTTLRSSGVTDLLAFFGEHPEEVGTCLGMVKVVAVNKATLDLYEASDQTSFLQGLSRIFMAESLDAFSNILRALFEGIDTYECEAVNQTLSGRKINVLLRWSLLPGTEDRASRALVSITDITERKRAEEALRASESRYRAIVDSQAEFVVRYQPGGIMTFVNDTMCRYTNMRSEDLLGRSYYPFVHPDDRAGFIRKIEALDRANPSMLVEARVVLPDGRESYQQWTNHAIFDDQGKLVEYQGTGRDVSERKLAETRIKESEKKYRMLFESAADSIFILDLDGNFIDANPAAYTHLGYTRAELLSMNIGTLDTPEYVDKVPGRLKQLREQGVAVFESANRRKDGSVMQIEVSARLLEYEGKPVLVSVNRDITERKRVEEELREKESKYRTLFEAANDGIFIQDSTGFRDCNQRGAAMYGLPKEKIIGRSLAEFAPERQTDGRLSAEVAGEKVHAALNGVPQVFQWQPLRADGRPFDVEITLSRLELGGELCLQTIIRDTSERKRAEDALRQSEARFRAIIESASVGILVVDVATRKFLYANPDMCRLLGYREEEFHSLTVMDLAVSEELPDSLEGFQDHAEGKLNITERTLKRKDGSTVRMSINSVSMEFDGLPCLVGFFTDITEKQLLEEERLKAQKLESIGTLAGGIAHDFNNLLQGVFGYISMAKLSLGQKERAAAMLEQAEKALHQSVNLTSQLLTFSKGGKPVRKMIDLRPVIEDAVKFALSGSRVTYDLSLSDDLCAVEADAGQIGQVVQNIVLNAEQAMPLGGRIEIAARNIPGASLAGVLAALADELVEITVRDQGTGIPPEHLPRIFDPYFTTKEKGSGLGLATSYSIIKNHDGMISVSSELGKGSTFIIYLPASCAAQEQAASASAGRVACRKGRVLVMDDEDMVRVVAGELLRELGHEAEFAEHGDGAIEKYTQAKAEGRPFDVVILDLTVRGGKGGAETLRELLKIDPGVKVVVSSGYSDDEVIATYRQHGFRSFLKKPYDIEELDGVLNDVMA